MAARNIGNKTKNVKKYSVGVIIRTLNEQKYIEKCIDILHSQNMDKIKSVDILVIDSGSKDNTVNIAKKKKCRLIEIEPASFNFGGTLNLGFKNLETDLVICLSAHAIPEGVNYLDEMVRCFDDKSIIGVYSKQMPWPDADFTERVRIEIYFDSEFRVFSRHEDSLHFSNVSSCIRYSAWERVNFKIVPASEDAIWAEEVLNSGGKIVYNPGAVVYHSHKESALASSKRYLQFLQKDVKHKQNNFFRELLFVIKFCLSPFKESMIISYKYHGTAAEKAKAMLISMFIGFYTFNNYYIQKYKN